MMKNIIIPDYIEISDIVITEHWSEDRENVTYNCEWSGNSQYCLVSDTLMDEIIKNEHGFATYSQDEITVEGILTIGKLKLKLLGFSPSHHAYLFERLEINKVEDATLLSE